MVNKCNKLLLKALASDHPQYNLSSGHLREPMISCAVGTTYWIPEAVTYKRELSLKVYSIKSHDGTATCSASKIKGENCNYFCF